MHHLQSLSQCIRRERGGWGWTFQTNIIISPLVGESTKRWREDEFIIVICLPGQEDRYAKMIMLMKALCFECKRSSRMVSSSCRRSIKWASERLMLLSVFESDSPLLIWMKCCGETGQMKADGHWIMFFLEYKYRIEYNSFMILELQVRFFGRMLKMMSSKSRRRRRRRPVS